MISPTAGAFPKDQNRVAMTNNGFLLVNPKTLTASNTTVAVPIFNVVGQCIVKTLYTVITTTTGNCTVCYWRLNDGSVQTDITLNTGATLTNSSPGGLLSRRSIASVIAVATGSGQGRIQDPVAATAPGVFMPFIVGQKAGGGATNIEFVYTTTDTPTTGSLDFYIGWLPLTPTSYISVI